PAQTAVEQYEFCRVHRGEGIIIPYGIEKGYPLHIDFTILSNRVRSLKNELLKIIKGQRYSEYRVDAVKRIQEMEVSKANSSLLQINYFESSQPRYYGTKGLAIILQTLTEMFVQPKILTTNLCTPQSPSQYLAQVLVPETAIRLIAEDFNNISLDMAKKIIIDSIEFGL
ncbi:8095_t:CDS:2, partial [Racocetra persica]